MEECDEDGDGCIDYGEFVPIMVGLVRSFAAKQRALEKQGAVARGRKQARGHAANMLLHGMSRAQLEGTLKQLFDGADADGSGVLDRKEFATCLRSADLGLSRKAGPDTSPHFSST